MPRRNTHTLPAFVLALPALIPFAPSTHASPPPAPYRADRPLLELQQAFIDLRFGMFIHYNMATYQDREWGDPLGSTDAFNPTALDTDQWARGALSAGMTYGCLTTKHHDGFCLWPTNSGGDSILKTPGQLDIVRAYTDSFRKAGLKVGLYYSILDLRGDIRHHNVTPEKIARIKLELTELLTNYGPIDILIFDGWDAPWSRITYEEVPFHDIYALIKQLQPNCLIAELNAALYPPSGLFYSDIKSYEQNAGQNLPEDSSLPALSCVTLSDGWFWKQADDNAALKPAAQVVHEWLLPQNARYCNLICNAAPNREGKLSPNLVARMEEIGALLRQAAPLPPVPKVRPASIVTTTNLATERPIRASESPDTIGPDMANDGRFNSTWYIPDGSTSGWIEVELPPDTSFNTIMLAEPIGRWPDYATTRIRSFTVEAWDGNAWRPLVDINDATPIRIYTIPRTGAERIRFSITSSTESAARDSSATPHISEIGIYDEPARN